MFDQLVATASRATGGASVAGWARVEAAACARRLAGMVAMLDARHAADGSANREQWYLDNWGAVAAEIGAAQNITAGAASHQLLVATALRDRLPKVAALFAQGLITYPVVAAVVSRTMLILDPAALAAVDTALADDLQACGPRSRDKLNADVDAEITRHDPHAVRRTQSRARSRSLDIDIDDASGIATVWATVFADDGKALDETAEALAATVCDRDPRTLDERRSDALGALAKHQERLTCRCGDSNCPAGDAVPSPVTVYVVVNDDTLDCDTPAAVEQDAALDGPPPPLFDKPLTELTVTEALTDPDPGQAAATRPGILMGGPVLAGPLTRRAALGATIRRILHPGDTPPEPRYRPLRALAEFVRCRDLTCRFPGCDAPATHCDLDHTIPWPYGPTQASNLACLCRYHHLLKTFWGWQDRQYPDGTLVWTAPDGQTYTTHPGSRLLFPTLCRPTAAAVVDPTAPPPAVNPGLRMPRRDHTRTQDRRRRIHDERQRNAANASPDAAQMAPWTRGRRPGAGIRERTDGAGVDAAGLPARAGLLSP